jgi:hypothetical protein
MLIAVNINVNITNKMYIGGILKWNPINGII